MAFNCFALWKDYLARSNGVLEAYNRFTTGVLFDIEALSEKVNIEYLQLNKFLINNAIIYSSFSEKDIVQLSDKYTDFVKELNINIAEKADKEPSHNENEIIQSYFSTKEKVKTFFRTYGREILEIEKRVNSYLDQIDFYTTKQAVAIVDKEENECEKFASEFKSVYSEVQEKEFKCQYQTAFERVIAIRNKMDFFIELKKNEFVERSIFYDDSSSSNEITPAQKVKGTIGFKNLGVTCFLNSVLKAIILRKKSIYYQLIEDSTIDSKDAQNLKIYITQLYQILFDPNSTSLDYKKIENILNIIANHPTLDGPIRKVVNKDTLELKHFQVSQIRSLIDRFFSIFDMNVNFEISVRLGTVSKPYKKGKTVSTSNIKIATKSEATALIQIASTGSTIEKRIQNYCKTSIVDDYKSIKYPDVDQAENKVFFYAEKDKLPKRLMFETFPYSRSHLLPDTFKVDPLTDIKKMIKVPLSNEKGEVFLQHEMELTEVICNPPNHFYAVVKEDDDTWTLHNDSSVKTNLSFEDVKPYLMRDGNIFCYRVK